MDERKILVEVAYATSKQQIITQVAVPEGASVEMAIRQSGVLDRFPEIDLSQQKVGIFSKPCQLERIVQTGERIEIYRPLSADPKTLRRIRAQKAGSKTSR